MYIELEDPILYYNRGHTGGQVDKYNNNNQLEHRIGIEDTESLEHETLYIYTHRWGFG